MKKPKHITWVWILMMVSQLLLTAFVIQWIFAQYAVEKAGLKKELQRQMNESQQQVIDSTLVVHLIDPMIRDAKCDQQKRTKVCNDSLSFYKLAAPRKFTAIISQDEPERDEIYTFNDSDTIRIGLSKTNSSHLYHDSNNVVLHSIRLMINQTVDNMGENNPLKQFMSLHPDTTLFKKIFDEKISSRGWKFSTVLMTRKPSDSIKNHGASIFVESRVFSSSIGAEVRHFNTYLLTRIIPQALFALILLILTGTAFYISYRSLKNQIMLNTLRNDFISNISHELKTPVATVKVALEAIRNFDMKKDPAVSAEYLRMASLEMDRLDQLITKVLNTSLLEESRLISLETTNLKPLVREVLDSMQQRLSSEAAAVNFDAEEDYYYANLDKLHVQGVLINLIDNSLKYALEKPVITIRLEQSSDRLILQVSDNGPGIPENHLHKVFDKFFRVPTGDRHNVKGHGLGLSYADMVMKQHRGSIRVTNMAGGGCLFELIFPKK